MKQDSVKRTARPAGWKRGAYILRTCAPDLSSNDGKFRWPESGLVEAPDWKPTKACGHGLHGFLNGEGDGRLANFDPDAKWIVAEIEEGWIDLSGKVKFPRAFVVHCGDRLSATQFIADAGCKGAIVGGTATAGDGGTAIAGDYGMATAGYRGMAAAGDYGTATAGVGGTATAGYGGTATVGVGGTILIRFYDYKANRYRIVIGYVGEDGIEPNTPYCVEGGKLVEA